MKSFLGVNRILVFKFSVEEGWNLRDGWSMKKIGIDRNVDDIIISDLEMQIKVLYITDDDQDMSCLMWLLNFASGGLL